MKSHIHITHTENCNDVPAAPDSAVLLSSADKWAGIKVEHHILPPAEMPEHLVKEHRLIINMGKPLNFEWKVEGKWVSKHYKTGNFTMLSHGELHAPRWDKDFNFIAIALSPNFTDKLIEVHDFSFTEQRVIADKLVCQLSLKLWEEIKQEDFAGKVYGESLAIALAIHLASNYSANKKKVSTPKGRLSSVQLHQIIDYTNSYIHQNIGLAELAEQANISSFHFVRLFKQTIGISPHQYILQLKMERARLLINQNRLSLTEIAFELGFTDQAHFSNAFKKVVGVPPSQYRQM